MDKPHLKKAQLWHINLGLLGINFAWGLQMANMSAIYESLGATAEQIPILWLAAPLTGLLVQPVMGWLSDHTWCRFGRRRPYFLLGTIFCAFALVLMPLSHSLFMAAALLWLLDAMVNVAMGPFRALIPDLLPAQQQKQGFTIQGICIALGSACASFFPWLLEHVFHVAHATVANEVPLLIKLSFWVGACVLMVTMLWSFFTVKETPPAEPIQHDFSFRKFLRQFKHDVASMPVAMQDLSWVMMFSWMGMFCMFLYLPVAVIHRVFHAQIGTLAYEQGLVWVNVCFGAYSLFVLLTSLVLPWALMRYSPKVTHAFCLLCGGLALSSIVFIQTKWQVLCLMLGVGTALGSMFSVPYTMVSQGLPKAQLGSYMGIFNLFIVIPEIVVSLGFGWVMDHLLGGERYLAVMFGGVCMILAAGLTLRVRTSSVTHTRMQIQQQPS
ncbi:MAG: MFS transporter [Gammaproteobacteria bacterium]|nr:MFS transporter [Gammaproteobacteria bacterium]